MNKDKEKQILEAFILMMYGKGSLVLSKIQGFVCGNSIEALFSAAFKGSNYGVLSEAGCRFADVLDGMISADGIDSLETNLPYEILWPWCRKHCIRLVKATRMVCENKGNDAIVTGKLMEMDCSGLSL